MNLIDKEKIEEAAKEYSFFTHGDDELFEIDRFQSNVDFKHGAQFAQNEFNLLACEFAEWCYKEIDGSMYGTEQLLEIWLKERSEKQTMKELKSLLEFSSDQEKEELNDWLTKNKNS